MQESPDWKDSIMESWMWSCRDSYTGSYPIKLCKRKEKIGSTRKFKQQWRQRQWKRHLKINIWEMVTILLLFLTTLIFDKAHGKWNLQKHHWSKYREWKICCCVFTLSLKPWIWKFHVVIWIKVRGTCAARLFFLIQPDRALFSGIVIAFAIVHA